MEANTSQLKWFVPCCKNNKCLLCNGTGKQYLERCPVYYYDDELKALRYLYESFNFRNILPFSGSPIEQPKVLFTVFETIDYYVSFFNDLKEEQKEKNKAVTNEIRKRLNRD